MWTSHTFRNVGIIGVAAAAVAAFVLFWPGAGGTRAGLALADVVEHVRTARTLSMRQSMEIEGQPPVTAQYYVLDGSIIRAELPNGRIMIADERERRGLLLIPAERRAVQIIPDESGEAIMLYDWLRGLRERSADEVSREQRDGRTLLVFRVRDGDERLTVWADEQSGLPVRIESPWRVAGADRALGRSIISDIAFDAPLDAALFELQPPEGYTLQPPSGDPQTAFVSTGRRMLKILMACTIHEQENGAWPAALTELERYGITADMLRNPARPQFDPGFVYIRPEGAMDPARVVLYEAHGAWDGGAFVGFQDGHVEQIASEERFQRLLAGGAP